MNSEAIRLGKLTSSRVVEWVMYIMLIEAYSLHLRRLEPGRPAATAHTLLPIITVISSRSVIEDELLLIFE